jgi:NAD(P)-dependent dehydrogenase (short-subunit alcohol dehydrogenase family)
LELLKLQNFRLGGRVALVTGAAQGIGLSITEILALNGARVAMCDVNRATLLVASSAMRDKAYYVRAYPVDVSKANDVNNAVRKVERDLGTVEILVNNAGILRRTPFRNISQDEWKLVNQTNVDGAFNFCKAVIEGMIERRWGKIINVSSSAGRSTSTFGGAHYTTSKAGLLGLTRHLAREVARYGINVNAVCPGSIDTPMVRTSASRKEIEESVKKIPMGHLGTPEDIANLVLFLASDASSYITGASIDINAGELMI